MQTKIEPDIAKLTIEELKDCFKEFKNEHKILLDANRDMTKNINQEVKQEEDEVYTNEEIKSKDILEECIIEDYSSSSNSIEEPGLDRQKFSTSIGMKMSEVSKVPEFVLADENSEIFSEEALNLENDASNDSFSSDTMIPTKAAQLEQEFLNRILKNQSPKISPSLAIETKPIKEDNRKSNNSDMSPLVLDSSLMGSGNYFYTDVYKLDAIKLVDNELSMKTCEVVISE